MYVLLWCAMGWYAAGLGMGQFGFGAGHRESTSGLCNNVNALVVWEGRLISGHGSGKLRVWNAATGECYQVLEGDDSAVSALAVCGSRLVSRYGDGSIQVWRTGADDRR